MMTGANIDFDQSVARRLRQRRTHPITEGLRRPRWRRAPCSTSSPSAASSVDLYGQQVGGRLEDMATFVQGGRRLPRQHRHRHGPARPEIRRSSPASATSTWAASSASSCEREGVDDAGRRAPIPQRLTALVMLGVRDEKHLPADLLPRRLRRHGARRERHRRGLHRLGRRHRRHRHAFLARRTPPPRRRRRSRIAKAHGRKVVFDIDYRPNLWGLAGHGAGEERYVALRRRHRSTCRPILPDCDLIVGTEEELHIAGGSEDTLQAIRAIRALHARRPSSASAARWAASSFPARSPPRSRTASRAPASRSRSTTCSARATPSCPASCAAGCATSRSRPAAPMPMPAAPSRCRACCARRKARPGRSCSTSSRNGRRTARCARTRRSTTSTGRRRAGREPDRLMALAIDHRAQLEEMADARRRAARAHRAVQGAGRRGRRAGRRRAAGLRHAARRHLWPRGAVPRRRPSVLDRPAGRAAGLAPAGFRDRRHGSHRREAGRMAGHPHGQVPVLLPPRRPRRAEARGRSASCAASTTPRARSAASCWSRSSPASTARSATTPSRRVLERLYALGIKPDWWKLEPQPSAAAWQADRRDASRRTIRFAAACAARPRCAGGRAGSALSRSQRACAAVKGFAVGRTIFADAARAWLAGEIDDEAAVDRHGRAFRRARRGVAAGPRLAERGRAVCLNRWAPPSDRRPTGRFP